MTEKEFFERLRSNPHPVVIDFWAPWCMPCRAISPVMEKLGMEYAGRVDLWKINVDEEPELIRSLHIIGIPTLIAFREGREVARHIGAASATVLAGLFESALTGRKPERSGPAAVDRVLRLVAGLALVVLAFMSGLPVLQWGVAGLGALVMFTAVYDRCPIYRMVSGNLRKLFGR